MTTQGRITRVVLKNYKSIASCDVPLGPLTILVGPNGAGKSNFIDAMRFCRDALRTPLDQVFAKRNTNLYHLRHRSPANPESLGMRFDFALDAAAESIAGHADLRPDLRAPLDPESIRDAKGWLQEAMPPGRRYLPTVDQPSLAGKFDLNAARRAPSFDKLYHEIEKFCSLAIPVKLR
jgi:hypothetical protein